MIDELNLTEAMSEHYLTVKELVLSSIKVRN